MTGAVGRAGLGLKPRGAAARGSGGAVPMAAGQACRLRKECREHRTSGRWRMRRQGGSQESRCEPDTPLIQGICGRYTADTTPIQRSNSDTAPIQPDTASN